MVLKITFHRETAKQFCQYTRNTMKNICVFILVGILCVEREISKFHKIQELRCGKNMRNKRHRRTIYAKHVKTQVMYEIVLYSIGYTGICVESLQCKPYTVSRKFVTKIFLKDHLLSYRIRFLKT